MNGTIPTERKLRFWSRVDKDGPVQSNMKTKCWVWTGATGKRGYGFLGDDKAHRLSWSMYHKKAVPSGMCICHKCDNPPCVRPGHLWLGTRAQNNADMQKKGRASGNHDGTRILGNRNPNSRLTEGNVRLARKLYEDKGWSILRISKKFKVIKDTIWLAATRRTWAQVE